MMDPRNLFTLTLTDAPLRRAENLERKQEGFMNARNMLTLGLVILLVALITVLGSRAQPVEAIDQTNEKPSPMVGLARGQTARLNIVNYSAPDALPPPVPCQGELLFFDGDGTVLQRALWTLEPNKAAFLDLPFSALSRSGNRVEIRGVVKFIGNPGIKQCARHGLASLEVYTETTGITTLLVSGIPVLKK
jgi:hypothetical protein